MIKKIKRTLERLVAFALIICCLSVQIAQAELYGNGLGTIYERQEDVILESKYEYLIKENRVEQDTTFNSMDIFIVGDGTAEDPYHVSTAEQLNNIRYDLNAHYIQVNDIDLSKYEDWKPIGITSGSYSIPNSPELCDTYEPFKGVYNGCGYTISNLTVNIDEDDTVGLFGACAAESKVYNINLSNVSIKVDKSSTDYEKKWGEGRVYPVNIGGVAGISESTISNCSVKGVIDVINCNDAFVGGIVGFGTVENSKNYANVYVLSNRSARRNNDGTVQCGGITGQPSSGKLKNNINYGNIKVISGNFLYLGGISGKYGLIENCINYGVINGSTESYTAFSSFAGNCNVGGIVGATSSVETKSSINYGNISGTANKKGASCNVGGIAGYYGFGNILYCYNLADSISSKKKDNTDSFFIDDHAGRISGYSVSTNFCYSIDSTIVNGNIPTDNIAENTKNCTSNGASLNSSDIEKAIYDILKAIDPETNEYVETNNMNDIRIHVYGDFIAPISDAEVTVEGFGSSKTDINGKVEFENTLTEEAVASTKITIKKPGYRDYIFYHDIYHKDAEMLFYSNNISVNLRKIEENDITNPYVSTLMCRLGERIFNAKDGSSRFRLGESSQICKFHVLAVWNGKTPDSYILYQKDGNSYISTDGDFLLDMGYAFDAGKDIYIKLVATDETTVEEKTTIMVEKGMSASNDDGLALVETDSTGVLGEEVAFLSGQEVGIEIKGAKIKFSYENGKVRATIGKDRELSEGDIFTNKDWEEWKKLCETQRKDLNLHQWKNVIDSIETPYTRSVQGETKVYGYLEGSIDNNGEAILKGRIKLDASLSASIQTQYTVGVIPVYAKISIGVDGEANGAIAYNMTKGSLDMEQTEITLLLEPFLKAEGGVGVMAVATVGIEGTGSLPFSTKIGSNIDTTLSLKGELALKAKLLTFEYKLNLAEREKQLLPLESRSKDNMKLFNSVNATELFEVADRSYLEKESRWLGDNSIQARSFSVKEVGMVEKILQTNIYPNSEMLMVETDNTKMILWTIDDAMRGAVDRTKLVYSVYEKNTGTWSIPQAVADDGTADYAPTVVSDDSHIYVAWQNMAEIFGNDAELSAVVAESEISLCIWEDGTGFQETVRLSESGHMAVSPKIALNGDGNPFVAYIQNTENNLLLTTGDNDILYAVYDENIVNRQCFIKGGGLITSLDTAYINGYEMSYTKDTDGDLSTLEDREIYKKTETGTGSTDNTYMDSNAQYVMNHGETLCFWYQDGKIIMEDALGESSCIYEDETGSLTDEFTVISGKENQLAVIWTAVDENDWKQIEGILYDGTEQKWSKSIRISDTDANIYQPRGIFLEDGSMQFLYKKTNGEQTDLCILMVQPTVDLSVEHAYVSEELLIPGTVAQVTVEVKNNGTKMVNNYIMDIDGTSTVIAKSLAPGESTVITAGYAVPAMLTHQDITITVNAENDINPSNDSFQLTVGYTDLMVNLDDIQYEDYHIVKMNVANISYVDTDAILEIRKDGIDGEVIKSIVLGTLSNGAVTTATYVWNLEAENYSDKINELYFVVVSEQEERYTNDNYDFIVAGSRKNTEEEEQEVVKVVSITASKTKTVYKTGETLNTDDIEVTAAYSNSTEKKVTGFTTNVDEINMRVAGQKTLEITYTENDITVKATLSIQVEEEDEEMIKVVSIAASKMKTIYIVGESLNINDIEVTAIYSDTTEKNVTGYITNAAGIDMQTVGRKTLEITYIENGIMVKTTLDIQVKEEETEEAKVVSITASKIKTIYTAGETLNTNDIEVIATYSDAAKKKVMGYTTNAAEINMGKAGRKTLEITYAEGGITVKTTLDIQVKEEENNNVNSGGGNDSSGGGGGNAPSNGDESALTDEEEILESISISNVTVSSIKKQTYTGERITPDFTIIYNGQTLVEGKDFTVKYSNNKKIGKATITITGKGNYTGTKEIAFNIVPNNVSFTSAKSNKTKTLILKWKKVSIVDGYQIVYSTDKNFKTKKTVTSRKTSLTLNKLKKGSKYYVKIRAYKEVKGEKYYGAYSKIKSVKVN